MHTYNLSYYTHLLFAARVLVRVVLFRQPMVSLWREDRWGGKKGGGGRESGGEKGDESTKGEKERRGLIVLGQGVSRNALRIQRPPPIKNTRQERPTQLASSPALSRCLSSL